MEQITIKEASVLFNKVPLTIRRAIYKAPDNVKHKDEKGAWYIDKDYLTGLYNRVTNANNTITPPVNESKVNVNDTLVNELSNKQKTINSLNDRLSESHQIIESQRQQISGLNQNLLESNTKLLEAGNVAPVIEKIEVPVITEKVVTVKDTTKVIGAFLYGMVAVISCFGLMIYFFKG